MIHTTEEEVLEPGNYVFLEPEAACPSGKVLLGGGATTNAFSILFYDGPAEEVGGKPNAWLTVYLFENGGASNRNVRASAYAYCAYVQ